MRLARCFLGLAATAAPLLSGCWFQPFDPAGHACATQDDCLAGYRCELQVCVPGEPLDAGLDADLDAAGPPPDAPTDAPRLPDVGPPDVGFDAFVSPDAFSGDTGPADDAAVADDARATDDVGPVEDAGPIEDTGASPDTGASEDAGSVPDAGTSDDTGVTGAGDAGPSDAGHDAAT